MKTSPVHVETLATRKIFSFHPSHLSECPPLAECCRGHRDERDAAYALGNPWSLAVGTRASQAARAHFPGEGQRWREGSYRPGHWCLLSASPGKSAYQQHQALHRLPGSHTPSLAASTARSQRRTRKGAKEPQRGRNG